MTVEENKAVVRRFIEECWNAGRLEVADEVLAETIARNGQAMGVEGMRAFIAMVRAAMPDYHSENEDVLCEGDRVAWRYTSRGTHTGGPLFGVQATGKELTISGTAIFSLVGGRIVEIWDRVDMLPVYQQLGLVTPSGPAAH